MAAGRPLRNRIPDQLHCFEFKLATRHPVCITPCFITPTSVSIEPVAVHSFRIYTMMSLPSDRDCSAVNLGLQFCHGRRSDAQACGCAAIVTAYVWRTFGRTIQ